MGKGLSWLPALAQPLPIWAAVGTWLNPTEMRALTSTRGTMGVLCSEGNCGLKRKMNGQPEFMSGAREASWYRSQRGLILTLERPWWRVPLTTFQLTWEAAGWGEESTWPGYHRRTRKRELTLSLPEIGPVSERQACPFHLCPQRSNACLNLCFRLAQDSKEKVNMASPGAPPAQGGEVLPPPEAHGLLSAFQPWMSS